MDNGKIIADGTKESLKELVSNENKIDIYLTNTNHTIIESLKKVQGVKQLDFMTINCLVSNRVIKCW